MSKPLVSVLVPVYNASNFLPECLDSISRQIFSNYELIFLNDGSTDDSLSVLREYKKLNPKARIINKSNSGYGDTLNLGLSESKGKYIAIVEPDDFLQTTYLKKLIEIAEKHSADFVKSNYFEYSTKTKKDIFVSDMYKNLPTNAPICPSDYPEIFLQPPAIWTGLYRRSFLFNNQITFRPSPGASYQDAGFNIKNLSLVKKAVFIPDPLYHYRIDNSASSVKSSGKVFAVKEEYDDAESFLRKKNILTHNLQVAISAARLNAYLWNYQRLQGSVLTTFSDAIRPELNNLIARKIVPSALFSRQKLLFLLHPFAYRLAHPLQRLRNSLVRLKP